MKNLKMLDTGSPRGEPNYYYVELNGVLIFESRKKTAVQEVYDRLRRALDTPAPGVEMDAPVRDAVEHYGLIDERSPVGQAKLAALGVGVRTVREVPNGLSEVEKIARTMWKGEPIPGRVLRFGAAVLGMAEASLAAGVKGRCETCWGTGQNPQWPLSVCPDCNGTAREDESGVEVAHTDHPMRHWDRTCPACNPDAAGVTTCENPDKCKALGECVRSALAGEKPVRGPGACGVKEADRG